MNTKMIKRMIALVLLVSVGQSAVASLVETDFLAPGDGLLFTDSVSGLEWVDVNKTTSMSVNQFLTTSIYAGEGFQLATTAQITQLFLNSGAMSVGTGTGSTNFIAGNLAAALVFYDLFEHELPYSQTASNFWIHGYEDFGSATNLTIARLRVNNPNDPLNSSTATFDTVTNGTSWTYDSVNGAVGIWAFREAVDVPAPATLALFGLGLVGLGWSRRKKV